MRTRLSVRPFFLAVLGLLLAGPTLVRAPSRDNEPLTYSALRPGVFVGASQRSLLESPAVRAELTLSDEQARQQEAIIKRHADELRAARELTDRKAFRAARQAAWDKLVTALGDNLQPAQRTRLAQIQTQVRGPVAFLDDDLRQRLGLTDEQRAAVEKLATEGKEAMFAAVMRPLPPGVDQTSTADDIRAFVATEAFRSAENDAQAAVVEAWARSVAKIEELLTDEQGLRYRELRGAPFDAGKLLSEEDGDRVARVAEGLGLTGQRADPNFDVSVARPAYPHPSVLFDEGHNNFHTAGGRYKPFVNLITNDGYRITPAQSLFTAALLAGHQVLIIANAERSEDAQAPESAFTEEECKVIEAWVKEGGSLLLITDHEPFGSASKELARRFGVDMSTKVVRDRENSTENGLLFSREKNLIGDHPITNGRDNAERINRVLTFAGQSLKGPERSVALLKLADTAKESGDEGEVSAAGRCQGLALTHGKGRVVIMGEAAELSAQMFGFPETERFGMNVPGCDNRQLALNIMHWLTGLIN